MTFNVRYGTAKDGDNHWEKRRELCASRVTAFDPDLLGLQEALDFQNAFILGKLPGHAQLGVAREDGKEKGEYTTLIYRKERFDLVESGTFWLSETPDAAGSKSWDSSLPRIATWAVFRDRKAGGRELVALNTHFDHRGVQARLESARRIRAFLESKAAGRPVVVTGDFNAAPGSAPYQALAGPALADVFAKLHPDPGIATGHGFRGERPGARIDWILASPHLVPRSAAIDLHREGPLFPSDHYPITAILAWAD
jgi:endonuclease/exonuclease/phosphatase family metal-dependent hydrolase